jgi:hypothetical protein
MLRCARRAPCGADAPWLHSQSQRSGLNRRPLDYESSALPLSYAGNTSVFGGAAKRRRSCARRTPSASDLSSTHDKSAAPAAAEHQSGPLCGPAENSCQCPGTDSNRDALRHHPLKMACLPISPPGQSLQSSAFGVLGRMLRIRIHRGSTTNPAQRAGRALNPHRRCGRERSSTTGPTGFEPATSRVTVECSNQLSYGP